MNRKPLTYCGLDSDGLLKMYTIMCELEDQILMTDEEEHAFDIAIQCMYDMTKVVKDKRFLRTILD